MLVRSILLAEQPYPLIPQELIAPEEGFSGEEAADFRNRRSRQRIFLAS